VKGEKKHKNGYLGGEALEAAKVEEELVEEEDVVEVAADRLPRASSTGRMRFRYRSFSDCQVRPGITCRRASNHPRTRMRGHLGRG
jgi:hypothetical protein